MQSQTSNTVNREKQDMHCNSCSDKCDPHMKKTEFLIWLEKQFRVLSRVKYLHYMNTDLTRYWHPRTITSISLPETDWRQYWLCDECSDLKSDVDVALSHLLISMEEFIPSLSDLQFEHLPHRVHFIRLPP